MASFYLIMGLVVSLIIAIIALANDEVVRVSYLFGQADLNLIVLILGSAITGALVMGLFSLFRGIRSALLMRQARQREKELHQRIAELENQVQDLLTASATEEVQRSAAGPGSPAGVAPSPSREGESDGVSPHEAAPGEEDRT